MPIVGCMSSVPKLGGGKRSCNASPSSLLLSVLSHLRSSPPDACCSPLTTGPANPTVEMMILTLILILMMRVVVSHCLLPDWTAHHYHRTCRVPPLVLKRRSLPPQ
ncbi:hypothetical protein BDW42DRAFT_173757 [Aspergillus taichungensis]|uniref:Uncharacterized protein n=1 Tax=Aspergillus taichungensis TaxID=482145 RepID=A0A2J5HP10_9EURO|nr:hypothetical protein BDW42DRAFT_173757 [Aspergillus taichungensis]